MPNSDHSLDGSDAFDSLGAFYTTVVTGRARPRVTWTAGNGGSLEVTTSTAPLTAKLWSATNPAARDFRLETFGKQWVATPLTPSRPNTWQVHVRRPEKGWTASFVEFTFDVGATKPLTVTTDVRVTPETMPFPAPSRTTPTQ